MAQSVLIAGCSAGGIGDHLAREYHARGFRVFASARDLTKLEKLKQLGVDVLPLDVTSAESIQAAAQEIGNATGGTLDILINNSGSGYSMPILDTDIDVIKEMFDVNVFGIIRVTQAFIKLLIATQGKVVNLGSIVGTFPAPLMGVYNASKAAMNLLSDNMRNEFKPLGVGVITVFAGTVETNIFNNQPTAKLPGDSMYIPIKTKAESIMNGGELLKGAMNPREFARGVVNHTLKKNPTPRFWYGGSSALVWFITTFFKHTFLDSKVSKDSGLSELKTLLAKERSKS